ncbi:hypothetical protein [Flexistipes sinusarabici]|uniref:hypothetical protein n=1 Tax=Flexistipes sinusarabici TaxID=2352 RepID=UPI002355F0C9|nr:hypothetical protein [Flexistipes sinusarabici]
MRSFFIILFVTLLALPAFSSSYSDFANDMKPAYLAWKQGVLTTKANNQKNSIKNVNKFLNHWKLLENKYKNNPPEELKQVESFSEDISNVTEVAGKALAEIKNGEVIEAHTTLEKVRYILWNLRAKAGIVTLGDKLNDYHEIMEMILEEVVLMENPGKLKMLAERQGLWLKIKWNEILSFMQQHDYEGKIIEDATKEKKAVEKFLNYAEQGNIDKAYMQSGPIKKNFKKVFFSEKVY